MDEQMARWAGYAAEFRINALKDGLSAMKLWIILVDQAKEVQTVAVAEVERDRQWRRLG